METRSEKQTPFFLIILGALLGFLLFSILIFVTGLGAEGQEDAYEEQRGRQRLATAEQLRQDNIKQLTTVGWVNQEAGVVHVPVGQAMLQVMADLRDKPVKASDVKVPPPVPAEAPATDETEAQVDETETLIEEEEAAKAEGTEVPEKEIEEAEAEEKAADEKQDEEAVAADQKADEAAEEGSQ